MEYPDLTWLAGLLEGEGCFDLSKRSTQRDVPRVRLTSTDEDIVQRAADLIGRSYYSAPARPRATKKTYHTQIQGKPALNLMRQLLPHMGKRRAKRISAILQPYVGTD